LLKAVLLELQVQRFSGTHAREAVKGLIRRQDLGTLL